MPITSSAKKALRQSRRRREENLSRREAVKRAEKTYSKLVAEKNSAEAAKALSAVFQALDKAAKTNALAENTASRMKSRLSLRLAKLGKK